MAQDLLTQAAAAAREGDLEALGELLSSSPAVLTARASEGRTLLDLACRAATGDIAIPLNPGTPEQHAAVDLILNAGADPSAADQDNWAARNNQCDSMAALVALGADINANPFRGTPLLWACYSDKVEAAAWLLDHGADPDLRHDWGGEGHGVDAVAMHLAAQYNCVGCLNLLLDRGADPTIVDGAHGGTPKRWAESQGAVDAVEILKRRLG